MGARRYVLALKSPVYNENGEGRDAWVGVFDLESGAIKATFDHSDLVAALGLAHGFLLVEGLPVHVPIISLEGAGAGGVRERVREILGNHQAHWREPETADEKEAKRITEKRGW